MLRYLLSAVRNFFLTVKRIGEGEITNGFIQHAHLGEVCQEADAIFRALVPEIYETASFKTVHFLLMAVVFGLVAVYNEIAELNKHLKNGQIAKVKTQ